jgi:Cd2+/Zn2+-exporting ATPase
MKHSNCCCSDAPKPVPGLLAAPEPETVKTIAWLGGGAIALAAGMVLEHRLEPGNFITLSVFVAGYLLLGGIVLARAFGNLLRWKGLNENFLMAIATIGAFAIGEYAEAVGVMLFYQVGEFFQEAAVRKSKKSISALMNIRPDYANVQKDGVVTKTAPETVQVGDIIIVKPGEKIPLDGTVIEGEAMLDTSALTGESVPRKASVSDTVLSGCVNQNGLLIIRVTQTFGESTAAKIIDLVENAAAKKAPTEKFITKFARYYTPAVVALAALIALVPPLLAIAGNAAGNAAFANIAGGGNGTDGVWYEWLRRSLVFLVISCPCALVISVPLGFFGGIGAASRRGILIKGGNFLEALAKPDTVVFDKTGTLTKGLFTVTAMLPAGNFNRDTLLEAAACAEAFSNHPIALSILREYGKAVETKNLSEYGEIAGFGVSVNANGSIVLAGNKALMEKNHIVFKESNAVGTKVYVAVNNAFAGCIVISDEIKPDSFSAIAALKTKGVRKTVMLTGDTHHIATAIADELHIDEVYSGLLPWEKVEKIEMLNGLVQHNAKKQDGSNLVFVGDGINDAPVLAMAGVGVAMGGLGSDAAIEAADVVLMTDEPSKLVEAIDIARFTNRVVWQNIVFVLAVKAFFLFLGAMGVASMWEAVFADVGVALLTVLNAMRILRFSR